MRAVSIPIPPQQKIINERLLCRTLHLFKPLDNVVVKNGMVKETIDKSPRTTTG